MPSSSVLHHGFGGAGAGFRNLLQIAGFYVSRCLRFGDFYPDISRIRNLVAERFKPRLQPRHAHRRGPHIHAAAACPKIKRHADHANPAWWLRLRAACGNVLGTLRHSGIFWHGRTPAIIRAARLPSGQTREPVRKPRPVTLVRAILVPSVLGRKFRATSTVAVNSQKVIDFSIVRMLA